MVNKFIKYIFSLLLIPFLIFAQIKEELNSKNLELKNIRNEITNLESDLSKLSTQEKNHLSVLKKIDQQSLLLGRSIKNLEKEEKTKEGQIVKLENRITVLQKKIKKLQSEFGDYLIWLYKQGDNSTLKYIFNSESFNQALIRYKHLEYVHKESEETVNELNTAKAEMDESIVKLEKEIEEKSKIKEQKINENKKLLERKSERNSILTSLKKDKDNVVKEIDEKRKMEISIKQLIADLIEKERERERRYRTEKLKGNIVSYEDYFNYNSFQNFAELKGSLNWPIKQGKIGRDFGENKNDKTKTVTLNYGIDLIARGEKEVFAVAEGIVSAIEWIPGYGSVVIITHRDNFRTVYGHLTDINVLEGNKVIAGDLIGIVSESLEGNILHFEIWNERNYQNPQDWLVKK
ncbi:MAG: peptidoglycan DD-metalloendopeptidase family protein [Ignavibacteriales bacterium]|nr:peptidoglycan DD-metalloendopeptidase family protein [Ignavibacteriales bacterium]